MVDARRRLARAREESYSFEERLHKWMANSDAQNDTEEYLIYRNVCLSFDLDRVERSRLERRTSLIENSDEAELLEIHELGKRLFFDPSGAMSLRGNRKIHSSEKKTSWSGQAVDPDDPWVLVKKMESSEQGCQWLRDEWAALLGLLEYESVLAIPRPAQGRATAGPAAGRRERRSARRRDLRGQPWPASRRQERVCRPLERHGRRSARALPEEACGRGFRICSAPVRRPSGNRSWSTWSGGTSSAWTRNWKCTKRTRTSIDERTVDRLSFDPTPEGEALRSHELKCLNALFRGMENYRKFKARTRDGWSGSGGMERYDRGRDRSADRGHEVQESEGPRVGPVHSYAWAEGERESRERAVDTNGVPDRAAQPGCGPGAAAVTLDTQSGRDEVSQNATREANFDENVSTTQQQDLVEVTANSGVDTGLDKRVAQPRDDEGPVRNSLPSPVRERVAPRFRSGRAKGRVRG